MTPRLFCRLLFLSAFLSSSPAHAADKDTLVVCDDVTDPLTLDPQKEFSEKNHTLIQQMFEGLVRFGPDGEIVPALAERWERLDDKTVQFVLRRGVVFHNGEPFNAESVKFSIERYLNPKTGFPALGYISSLDRIEVIDDSHINVITKYPDGLLLNRLAGFIVLVPPKYYGKQPPDVLKEKPVGSGPFEFKRWEKGRAVVLSANKNYWEPGSPKVDHLVFFFIPREKQVDALLSGKVDLLTDLPGTRTLEVQANPNTHVVKSPTLYTIAGSFNLSGPLADVRVRKALNYAVDKDELIRYDLMGNGRPTKSLIFQGHPGVEEPPGLDPYLYDLAKAKKLLKESGIGPHLKLSILDIKATRAAKIIAASWKRIGIESEMYSTTDARMIEDVARKPWDMMIGSCPDPMHHPYFIQSIFLYSKSPFSVTKSTEVDSMFDRVVQETDIKEQTKRTAELSQAINQNAWTLFTYQRIRTYGAVKNLVFQPYLSGMPHFQAAFFAATKEP